MSQQQYPQQPGQQPYPGPYGPPPQPKRRRTGRAVGIGCGGLVLLVVLISVIAGVAGGSGSGSGGNGDGKATGAAGRHSGAAPTGGASTGPATGAAKEHAATGHAAGRGGKSPASTAPSRPKTVTFRVWGTAPSGALGPLSVTYGSDSDTRDGAWKDGGFTATLPFHKDAEYYDVSAQLQGSGDIHCEVTVDGHTKTAHASGGYNICDAQLSNGLFGDWE